MNAPFHAGILTLDSRVAGSRIVPDGINWNERSNIQRCFVDIAFIKSVNILVLTPAAAPWYGASVGWTLCNTSKI